MKAPISSGPDPLKVLVRPEPELEQGQPALMWRAAYCGASTAQVFHSGDYLGLQHVLLKGPQASIGKEAATTTELVAGVLNIWRDSWNVWRDSWNDHLVLADRTIAKDTALVSGNGHLTLLAI